MTTRALKGTFIRILKVESKLGLEINYAVILSSYFLIYFKNAMEIFYQSFFDDGSNPVGCNLLNSG